MPDLYNEISMFFELNIILFNCSFSFKAAHGYLLSKDDEEKCQNSALFKIDDNIFLINASIKVKRVPL